LATPVGSQWYSMETFSVETETEINELLKRVKPGMRVLEIGCNHGLFSCLLAKAVGPQGKVVSVDCVAENVMITQANAHANHLGNLSVLEYAVTECSAGKINVNSQTNGFIAEAVGGGAIEQTESISLDDLSTRFGPFDFLKLDVEGYEARILGSATTALSTLSFMAMEMHCGGGLERYGSTPRELMELIARNGFAGSYLKRTEIGANSPSCELNLVDFDPHGPAPTARINLFLHRR